MTSNDYKEGPHFSVPPYLSFLSTHTPPSFSTPQYLFPLFTCLIFSFQTTLHFPSSSPLTYKLLSLHFFPSPPLYHPTFNLLSPSHPLLPLVLFSPSIPLLFLLPHLFILYFFISTPPCLLFTFPSITTIPSMFLSSNSFFYLVLSSVLSFASSLSLSSFIRLIMLPFQE